MDELRRLIAHCTGTTTGAYTPSDFQEAGLNQDELREMIQELNEDSENDDA